MSKKISDSEKTILTGRIYPAIQSCVGNRYKIIVGYYAILGFLLANDETQRRFINSNVLASIASLFTFFVIHNSINYWLNAKEQWKLEKIDNKFPIVDILSSIVMTILIWGGYLFLKRFSCIL